MPDTELNQQMNMPTEIPTSETYGAGTYGVRIGSAVAAEDNNGILIVKVEYRITDNDYPNAPIFDRIRIGTEDDPLARDGKTWTAARSGGRRFQRLLAAAGVANCGEVQANCQALKDRQLSIKVTEREGKGDYAGQIFNSIPQCYPLGEKESSRDADKHDGAPAAAAMPRPTGTVPSTPMPVTGGGRYE